MGITISRDKAIPVFRAALDLARSPEGLPDEWLARTRRVGEARSKTFTPVLGTVLLAKATDRRVDALALRESEGHRGYSARSLAKETFVPECNLAGIDLRSSGLEPFNNQPFLRAARITPELHVKDNARQDLLYLHECLVAADFLEGEEALRALAAFLRARIEATESRTEIRLGENLLSFAELKAALDNFVNADAEGGKTGQAIGAAILDMVFEDVRTKRVNDPSSKWPGDVGAFVADKLVLPAEIKQRPFVDAELLVFARRLQLAGVHRGLVFAFGQEGKPLDIATHVSKAAELHSVDLEVYFQPSRALAEAVRWASQDLPETLARFPERGLVRLTEIDASNSRRSAWAALFSTSN